MSLDGVRVVLDVPGMGESFNARIRTVNAVDERRGRHLARKGA